MIHGIVYIIIAHIYIKVDGNFYVHSIAEGGGGGITKL